MTSRDEIKFSLERILGNDTHKVTGDSDLVKPDFLSVPDGFEDVEKMSSCNLEIDEMKYPTLLDSSWKIYNKQVVQSLQFLHYYKGLYHKLLNTDPSQLIVSPVSRATESKMQSSWLHQLDSRVSKLDKPDSYKKRKLSTDDVTSQPDSCKKLKVELPSKPISNTKKAYTPESSPGSSQSGPSTSKSVLEEGVIRIESLATPQARARLAKIPNRIGDFICKLCYIKYEDAIELAQHQCTAIEHVEYKCPECSKIFNCPANLASHRRWHRPKSGANCRKSQALDQPVDLSCGSNTQRELEGHYCSNCGVCGKVFKRQAYLKKHSESCHQSPPRDLPEIVAPNNAQLSPLQIPHPSLPLWAMTNPASINVHRQVSPSHPISIPYPGRVLESPTVGDLRRSHLCTLCFQSFGTSAELSLHSALSHYRSGVPVPLLRPNPAERAGAAHGQLQVYQQQLLMQLSAAQTPYC